MSVLLGPRAALALSALLFAFNATANAPEIEVSVQGGFYDVLSPHGQWLSLEGYGTVWRPSYAVVGDDFSPYFTGGHWEFTEFGWSWESDYPWGWVPFHHGRWLTTSDYGWVWVPGDVWGPAWVEWRVGGGNVGWVPMGPQGVINSSQSRWYWVPTDGFRERDFQRRRLQDRGEEERAYHGAQPINVVGQQASRGPDPVVVVRPGERLEVVKQVPRRLERGAVTAEQRLSSAPAPTRAPPAEKPAAAPAPRRPAPSPAQRPAVPSRAMPAELQRAPERQVAVPAVGKSLPEDRHPPAQVRSPAPAPQLRPAETPRVQPRPPDTTAQEQKRDQQVLPRQAPPGQQPPREGTAAVRPRAAQPAREEAPPRSRPQAPAGAVQPRPQKATPAAPHDKPIPG